MIRHYVTVLLIWSGWALSYCVAQTVDFTDTAFRFNNRDIIESIISYHIDNNDTTK
nr:hypothetical protein [Bacteroidota bacterium]